MANMLPQEEQRHNRREYAGRLGIVVLFFFFFTGIMALVVILPASLVARQRVLVFTNAIEQAQQAAKRFGGDNLTAVIEETKQKMAMVSERAPGRSVHEAFFRIAKDREAGVRVTGLSYVREGTGTSTLGVTGIAATREGLIAFTKRLEGEKMFTSVHLPIANLTLDKDIDFSLSVTSTF